MMTPGYMACEVTGVDTAVEGSARGTSLVEAEAAYTAIVHTTALRVLDKAVHMTTSSAE